MSSRSVATTTSPSEMKLDQRSSSPLPPKTSEKPSTSRRLPITLPESEPAHDLGQALRDREQRDDQLGRVAEGRVEEAADRRAPCDGPRARSPRRSARRAGSARRTRGRRRGRLAASERSTANDDRREEKRGPEEARTGRSLPALTPTPSGRPLGFPGAVRRGWSYHAAAVCQVLRLATGGAKSARDGAARRKRRVHGASCRCVRRTRPSAAAAESTATRSSIPAPASSVPVRSSTPTRSGVAPTSAACRRCTTSRSTSRS